MNAAKVVMLGVDAGDLAFIRTWLPQLPNFRRILETGVCRELDTTSGLLTGSVWPTFYTGRHPGEHGVYHHLQWDAAQMRIRRVADDWLYCEPFWYELARSGVEVTALDVPMTFPSRLRAGVEIINWGSHDQLGPFQANRGDLARDLRRRFGRHPMGPEIPVQKTPQQLARIRRNLVAGAARKGELIRWLLQSSRWQLFLAVFGECHRGGHILWPESGPAALVGDTDLLDVYRAVDAAIGGILAGIDLQRTALVLFSLHGMQANMSQEHFVPEVMQRLNRLYAGSGAADTATVPQRGLMRHLRRTLPARLQHAIACRVPVGVRDWVVSRATCGGHDWRHTPGFALLADYNGYLRFNLAGRERQGCLEAGGEAQRHYIDWLNRGFAGLRASASGRPLVRELVSPAGRFPGARSDRLPDLIVTWEAQPPATEAVSESLGTVQAQLDTGRSGNHRHGGFVAAVGAGAAHWQTAAHILDLAPLAMRACGARRDG